VPEDYRPGLDAWLALRGDAPGYLFIAVSKWGTFFTDRRPIAVQGIVRTVRRIRDASGIDHFSTHDCRRTLISDLLDKTDLQDVQLVAGHQDPKTTMQYDRRKNRRIEATAKLVRKPRGGRMRRLDDVDTIATDSDSVFKITDFCV
jgi:integrase